jgi:hypothetical protein
VPHAVTVPWRTLPVPGLRFPQATAGDDYVAQQGTLHIGAGTTTASIALTVRGDGVAEPDELVVIAFGAPQGAQLGGYLGLGFATIRDDE